MFWLHFKQVQRIAVAGTMLMRTWVLLDHLPVLCVQEIASPSAVMDETIKFSAGELPSQSIII